MRRFKCDRVVLVSVIDQLSSSGPAICCRFLATPWLEVSRIGLHRTLSFVRSSVRGKLGGLNATTGTRFLSLKNDLHRAIATACPFTCTWLVRRTKGYRQNAVASAFRDGSHAQIVVPDTGYPWWSSRPTCSPLVAARTVGDGPPPSIRCPAK